jgi:hypothetical protein
MSGFYIVGDLKKRLRRLTAPTAPTAAMRIISLLLTYHSKINHLRINPSR